MSTPQAPNFCPHKQNPQACLQCYHARANAPRESRAIVPPAHDPNRIVAPPHIQNVIDRGFANASGVQQGKVPPPQGPQAIQPAGRERPWPEQARERGDAPPPQVSEPFSYQSQPWTPNKDGVLVPPARRSLIDAAPRHPEAGK